MPYNDEPYIQDPKSAPGKKSGHKAFSALKNRNFRLLWFGMFLSINGMRMVMIARGWLVYTMTNSPLALGIVTAGMGIPLIVFSLFGGAVADRVNKRNLLLITQSCMSLISLTITILITTETIALWHLFVSSFLTGIVFSFSMPTRQAFLVAIVGKDELTNAIALNSTAMNICRIASPAAGGILLKLIGIPGVYWIVTLSYSAVVLTLLFIKVKEKKPAGPKTPLIKNVHAGLRYVRGNSILLSLLIMAFVPIIVATPYQTLMPVFAKNIFMAGETGFGFLLSAGGIGALCGSTLIASLGNIQRKGALMLISGTVFGTSLVFFALQNELIPGLICLFFVGIGGSTFMTFITSLIMGNTPQEFIGRVMSIFIMTFGLMPLAALPAGAISEAIGAPVVVLVGGAILSLYMIVVAVSQQKIRRLN